MLCGMCLPTQVHPRDFMPGRVSAVLNQTLTRYNTGYLDLVLLQYADCPPQDAGCPPEGEDDGSSEDEPPWLRAWGELRSSQRAGQVRSIGACAVAAGSDKVAGERLDGGIGCMCAASSGGGGRAGGRRQRGLRGMKPSALWACAQQGNIPGA